MRSGFPFCQQKALRSPRPFDDHDVGAREALAHQRHVVFAGRAVEPMHRGDRRLSFGEASRPALLPQARTASP